MDREERVVKFPHFFIDRPIFATVLSIVIILVGGISYYQLPVSQYPEVALPTVVVSGQYPGATADTVAKTVATPLEQQINGVEGMLYMESQCTSDGRITLTVTFSLGTDVDEAQVLVQNRVSVAEPRLPQEVRQIGLTTQKQSPNLLMVVHLTSPDGSLSPLYIANFAFLQMNDSLSRIDGIGDLRVFGADEYSMRIWLDMDKLASLEMTAGDVTRAIREQNVQVSAGTLGAPPVAPEGANQVSVLALGRLEDPDQFGEIIIKDTGDGRIVRLKDVGRTELGARDYSLKGYLDDKEAVALVIFERPGSNAVETSTQIKAEVERMSKDFPPGLQYEIVYNPTDFVEQSIDEVFTTLYITVGLVVLTVFIFLQGWRSTIIPVVAIPIALIGTFAVLLALGFSLNQLSLFGLVLAIGIVVDDAIVVVENCERILKTDNNPKAAAHQAMDEVGGALIATTLVLIAVFVPTAAIQGISGQFYRQFAITIAISTVISTFVSLTLTPALCGLLLRPGQAKQDRIDDFLCFILGWFFKGFNKSFRWGSDLYGRIIARVVRMGFVAMLIYVGLLVGTYFMFGQVPGGFIPEQDRGYVILSIELPAGRNLFETDKVAKKVREMALEVEGVERIVQFVGYSGATRTRASNQGAMFPVLADAKKRAETGRDFQTIINDLRAKLSQIDEAIVFVIPPPPVPGIGNGGGVKMQLQDRSGGSLAALEATAGELLAKAGADPAITQPFSTFRTQTPQLFADIDRVKARQLQVPITNIFETLQIYLGSAYVNDFNYLGRTYQVNAQAEGAFRNDENDILRLRTRSDRGGIVPLGSLVTLQETTGPDRVVRFNLFPAADINATVAPGFSTGQVIERLEEMAADLPDNYGYAWTDIAFQQKEAGNTIIYIFPLCVLFVFLALAAQYESWLLPLAIILIVPMCLLCGIVGIYFRGMTNNILVQIGFIVLVGLACKNAILIVEFAKQQEDEEGKSPIEAAIEACRLRLRPILMTSFSFVLGVIPLVIATGAGSEMRQALGTAVFAGMLGVTIFGLFLTPVFYVVLRHLSRRLGSRRNDQEHPPTAPPPINIAAST